MTDKKDKETVEEYPQPSLKETLQKLEELALSQEQNENWTMAKAFIAPIMQPRHYSLRGKILAHSLGVKVDISDDEWKQAEKLGLVEAKKEEQ